MREERISTIGVEKEVLVDLEEFISEVEKMAGRGARFVTASCRDLGEEGFEIIYHFDIDHKVENIRIKVPKGREVPSISPVFFPALLIENEIKDMFGVKFIGMAIDFDSKLLLHQEAPKIPLLKPSWDKEPAPERKIPPCREACPAGIDIPGYIRLIEEGKYKEAVELIRQQNPLVAISGRVCFAPCETKCRQTIEQSPLSIRLLKRYASDKAGFDLDKSKKPDTGKKVAIVGSGPAGLSCAFYLAKLGHQVVIFEALPKPGGMLRVGIPDYRLPQDILDAEIKTITDLGVEIRCNQNVESVDELFNQGFNAVFLALGAHQNVEMGIPGEEDEKVLNCVTMLRRVNLGEKVEVGEKVGVVGGGNSAIDAARVALRLGAKEVTIFYRRTRAEMPASPEEVEAALEEGIKIEFLCAPTKIERKGDKLAVTNIKMKLGEPDESGRRRPVPIEGSEYTVELDNLVIAIGQRPEVSEKLGVNLGRGNRIEADAMSMKTSRDGVFAGGDVRTGPASVVEAVADGRKAAIAIDKYLGGDGRLYVPEVPYPQQFVMRRDMKEARKQIPRVEVKKLDPKERVKNFNEVELGFADEQSAQETKRCWRCDWNE